MKTVDNNLTDNYVAPAEIISSTDNINPKEDVSLEAKDYESLSSEKTDSLETEICDENEDHSLLSDEYSLLADGRKQLQIDREALNQAKEAFDKERSDFLEKKRNEKSKYLDYQIQIEDEYAGELREARQKAQSLTFEVDQLNDLKKAAEESYREIKSAYASLLNLIPKDEEGTPVFDITYIQKESADLKANVESLTKSLAEYQDGWWGPDKQARYMAIESERDALLVKSQEMEQRIGQLEGKIHDSQVQAFRLRDSEAYAKSLEMVNDEFQEQISKISAYYHKNKKGKFSSLREIDDSLKTKSAFEPSVSGKTLEQIAKHVKCYGESGSFENVKLRYDENMICSFIASLSASESKSRLLILQGLSGTGKSSMPQLFARALGFSSSVISVQPSWRDRNDLLGFDNDFTGIFRETEFTRALYTASMDPKRVFFITLDEFNLSRIEYYFADFLSVLEKPKDEWIINLAAADSIDDTKEFENIKIPNNLWFVGTANIDESTQSITDKVYDRAQVIQFSAVPQENTTASSPIQPLEIGVEELIDLFDAANRTVEYQLDARQLKFLDEISGMFKELNLSYGARVEAQLQKYVPTFVAASSNKRKAKIDAIDIFIANKILYKLEKRFSISKSEKGFYEMLIEHLGEELGKDSRSYKLVDEFIKKNDG